MVKRRKTASQRPAVLDQPIRIYKVPVERRREHLAAAKRERLRAARQFLDLSTEPVDWEEAFYALAAMCFPGFRIIPVPPPVGAPRKDRRRRPLYLEFIAWRKKHPGLKSGRGAAQKFFQAYEKPLSTVGINSSGSLLNAVRDGKAEHCDVYQRRRERWNIVADDSGRRLSTTPSLAQRGKLLEERRAMLAIINGTRRRTGRGMFDIIF